MHRRIARGDELDLKDGRRIRIVAVVVCKDRKTRSIVRTLRWTVTAPADRAGERGDTSETWLEAMRAAPPPPPAEPAPMEAAVQESLL